MEELNQKVRIRVVILSLVLGILILVVKWLAYVVSGSAALKSDAIESIVNVVAAGFALLAIHVSGQPADKNHPYGHGKIEHFSSAFEGSLIALASVFILIEGVNSLISPTPLRELSTGLALNLAAGAVNGGLGWYLIRKGKQTHSRALEADGHHVLSDFLTTLALGVGLFLVQVTGMVWLDAVLAIGVGLLLGLTGLRLVKHAAQALLDEEDPATLKKIVDAAVGLRTPELIAIHELRSMRAGRFTHVDVHMVVPEHFSVGQAHDLVEAFGRKVMQATGIPGEFHSHVDPCRRLYCEECEVKDCPVRRVPMVARRQLNVETATAAGPAEDEHEVM